MSQTKTTRAFRTISEAGDELGLQPHVLRFWESKFSHIKPIKRGGGRRFYRPEDIEFIRGIKKLLHDEKHPIKDVQKLIKKKGIGRIIELGRSLGTVAEERSVAETDLLPKRIKPASVTARSAVKLKRVAPVPEAVAPVAPVAVPVPKVAAPVSVPVESVPAEARKPAPVPPPFSYADGLALEEALKKLDVLKRKMSDFRKAGTAE